MKYLFVIGGPTASGKTALAIRLARQFGTEVLSADSRQFYRGMDIGTAKPSGAELAIVPHHFIDSLEVSQEFSVGDFERAALEVLEKIYREKEVAVLAGGSGLFLQAVCEGLDAFPEISGETKRRVTEGEASGGLPWLQQEVARLDPQYFSLVDQQNPARLRRALQVCLEAGLPYSTFLNREKSPRPSLPIYILLELPRAELYARIDARVEEMMDQGLEQEAQGLWPYRHRPALRTVGYEEWFDFFEGKITRAEAIDKIKQHTRNYAKRQLTWFKKRGDWKAFHPEDYEGILAYLNSRMTAPNSP